MRQFKSEVTCLLALLAFCVVALYLLCSVAMDVAEQTLLRRTNSPNGWLDLLLFSRDAGATTSTGYFLQVVERGHSPDVSSAFWSLTTATATPSRLLGLAMLRCASSCLRRVWFARKEKPA
ncbi:MAG TPA: hypothetical protein VK934_06205 [Fimbriimonas sp.]|nr:hypothetical protein [Fimbriimonas sp.]